MKNQSAQIALKRDTDVAETRVVSIATMILRDLDVLPVSQPRIRLRRKTGQIFETGQIWSDCRNWSDSVRLSKSDWNRLKF